MNAGYVFYRFLFIGTMAAALLIAVYALASAIKSTA